MYPDLFAKPSVPGKQSSNIELTHLLRGNIQTGGTIVPWAPTVQQVVTEIPRSALVI